MPRNASSEMRLPHVRDLHPDVATLMLARAFAEVYRDVLDEPVPEPLMVILRTMKSRGMDRGRDAA
jgi:hypothetical protein